MGSTFNDLPRDLLLKIFYLQPVHSLIQLRNVCILWDQIISDTSLAEFYLARKGPSFSKNKFLLLEGFGGRKSTSLVVSQNHIYYDILDKNYQCYGICDELLCVSSTKDCYSTIVLWNPIFKKILPPLKIESSQLTYMCFGYHDDDYKVIKVVFSPPMYYVCVYSLSMDDWKVLDFDGNIVCDYMLSSWSPEYSKEGRLINGGAYFVHHLRDYVRQLIFFDLSVSKFRKIELPIDLQFTLEDFIMEEYRESLAIIGCDWRHANRDFVVKLWVLRESDNSFSWDEMILVKVERNYEFQPVGFINEDELVIRSASTLQVPPKYSFFLCNVVNGCLRHFATPETCASKVQSSRNVKSFTTMRFKDELRMYLKPNYSPTRKPMIKKVALISNSYAALADSGDD